MKITETEREILYLIDIKKNSINQVSKKLKISKREVRKTLSMCRKNILNEILENELIEIEPKEEVVEKKDICKFRCSICGTIYSVNYKNNEISCPMCYSNKVMPRKIANIN
ncbi:MAG: hypothetical protein R3Y64_06720 [Peptostreptococcaceae bacterium]